MFWHLTECGTSLCQVRFGRTGSDRNVTQPEKRAEKNVEKRDDDQTLKRADRQTDRQTHRSTAGKPVGCSRRFVQGVILFLVIPWIPGIGGVYPHPSAPFVVSE